MSGVLEEQKKWIAQPYSEPAAAQRDGLCWTDAFFKGKLINIYYNADLIHDIFTRQIASALPPNKKCMIADFCCGNGHVARTVASRLDRPDNCSVLPVGIDTNRKYLLEMKQITEYLQTVNEKAPRVQPFLGDLLHLPFRGNSFEAGILRFALPFFSKEEQQDAFKQIYGALKPGAVLVVLNYGVLNETEEAKAYNRLFAAGAAFEHVVTHNTSCKSLMDMAVKAEFKVDKDKAFDLTNTVFSYMSPEIYARLYNLNEGQKKSLETAFEEEKERGALPFEPKSLRVQRPTYFCVLEK